MDDGGALAEKENHEGYERECIREGVDVPLEPAERDGADAGGVEALLEKSGAARGNGHIEIGRGNTGGKVIDVAPRPAPGCLGDNEEDFLWYGHGEVIHTLHEEDVWKGVYLIQHQKFGRVEPDITVTPRAEEWFGSPQFIHLMHTRTNVQILHQDVRLKFAAMFTDRDVLTVFFIALIFVFAIGFTVFSATTISTNISTDGTLSVSGASTVPGLTASGGLYASSTLQAAGDGLFYDQLSAGASTNTPTTTFNVTGSGYFTGGLGVGYATTGYGNLLAHAL